MDKIQMKTPLVEMDGDEMTRIIWQKTKDELLCPYIDLKTEYYDLGLPERERSVVLLRYFHDLTQDKAARILGVSQVQVSRIERKAIEILRGEFSVSV